MLQTVGLTEAEQILYEALLSRRSVTGPEFDQLARDCGWSGQDGSARSRLEALGLVTEVADDPPCCVAVPPEVAVQPLLLARGQQLEDVRRRMIQLTARFHRATGPDDDRLVEVVHGTDAVLQRYEELRRSARREVRVCEAPPHVTPTRLPNALESEQLRDGVSYRILYDRRSVEPPGSAAAIIGGMTEGEQARVGEVPAKMILSDHPIGLLPRSGQPPEPASALVVYDSPLLDALALLFEIYWERAVPLSSRDMEVTGDLPAGSAGSAAQPGWSTPSGVERELLALLASGLTDQAIGAHVGWTDRTVRRRVRGMMTRLDVTTRFQAGYQAVLRGWLSDEDGGRDGTGDPLPGVDDADGVTR